MTEKKNASDAIILPNGADAAVKAADGKRRPHVLIGLSASSQMIYTNCFRSILSVQTTLLQKGVGVSIREFSDQHVAQARNEMVAAVLANPVYTHLLMLDADIGFDDKAVLRMLASNKDVVGGAYPRRGYDFGRLKDMTVSDPSKAMHAMLNFVLSPIYRDGNKVDMVKGFVKAKYVGAGCLVIKREALEKMAKVMSHLKYKTDKVIAKKEQPHLYGFFDSMAKNRDGKAVSDGYAFCERWGYHCFGEIWADVAGRYTRHGSSVFGGSWVEAMKAQQEAE